MGIHYASVGTTGCDPNRPGVVAGMATVRRSVREAGRSDPIIEREGMIMKIYLSTKYRMQLTNRRYRAIGPYAGPAMALGW